MTLDDYVHHHLAKGERGHFAAKLAVAWMYADLSNRRKLEAAWPELFTVPGVL